MEEERLQKSWLLSVFTVSVSRSQPHMSWIINNYCKIMSEFWTMVHSLSLYSGTLSILFLWAPTDYSTVSLECWSRVTVSNLTAFHILSICTCFSKKDLDSFAKPLEVDLFFQFYKYLSPEHLYAPSNVRNSPFWLYALLSCKLGVCENICFDLQMDN